MSDTDLSPGWANSIKAILLTENHDFRTIQRLFTQSLLRPRLSWL